MAGPGRRGKLQHGINFRFVGAFELQRPCFLEKTVKRTVVTGRDSRLAAAGDRDVKHVTVHRLETSSKSATCVTYSLTRRLQFFSQGSKRCLMPFRCACDMRWYLTGHSQRTPGAGRGGVGGVRPTARSFLCCVHRRGEPHNLSSQMSQLLWLLAPALCSSSEQPF